AVRGASAAALAQTSTIVFWISSVIAFERRRRKKVHRSASSQRHTSAWARGSPSHAKATSRSWFIGCTLRLPAAMGERSKEQVATLWPARYPAAHVVSASALGQPRRLRARAPGDPGPLDRHGGRRRGRL